MNSPIDKILKIIGNNEITCNKAGDMFIKYGISIKNPDGTYRGVSAILNDLSLVWDDLHEEKEHLANELTLLLKKDITKKKV